MFLVVDPSIVICILFIPLEDIVGETWCILHENLANVRELLIGSWGILCLVHNVIVLNFCSDLVNGFTGVVR